MLPNENNIYYKINRFHFIFTKLHQSTDLSCPIPSKISGAKYSGVPQKENVFSSLEIPSFDSPKSVSLMCPSSSNNTFSGFKSLK